MKPIMTEADKRTTIVPTSNNKRPTKKEKELLRDKINRENIALQLQHLRILIGIIMVRSIEI